MTMRQNLGNRASLCTLLLCCSSSIISSRFVVQAWIPSVLTTFTKTTATTTSAVNQPLQFPFATWTTKKPLVVGSSSSSTALAAVNSITLESLGTEPTQHESVGSELGSSVQRWLDAEWMPQEIHVQMGQSCAKTYVDCRQAGQSDLMVIMVEVAEELERNWKLYDKDAFVNAWDVSNYVSDYLTSKAGIEGCECSARIY